MGNSSDNILDAYERNDNWSIEESSNDINHIIYRLKYDDKDDKEDNYFHEFDYIYSIFLGITQGSPDNQIIHFYIKYHKKILRFTEPFKGIIININEEYDKWIYNNINELLKTKDAKRLDEIRKKAWEKEDTYPEFSEYVYKKLIEEDDEESYKRYAKFLRKKKNYQKAIDRYNDLIKKNKNPLELIDIYYQTTLTLCKDKKYKEALDYMDKTFESIFNYEKSTKSSGKLNNEKNSFIRKYFEKIVFYLLLLRKSNNYNDAMIEKHIKSLNNKREISKYNKNISKLLDKKNRKQISGILIWVDLVGSTEYKRRYQDDWYERIVYFLYMTTVIFKNFNYQTLKYIGDEVMLFKQFDENEEKHIEVKRSYEIIFDDQRWYTGEINRFNPKIRNSQNDSDEHYIYAKICVSVIEDAYIFYDVKNEDYKEKNNSKNEYIEIFDILGNKIDISAKIKNLATKDIVIANDKYIEYLNMNGENYKNLFINRMYNDEISYYERKIEQKYDDLTDENL